MGESPSPRFYIPDRIVVWMRHVTECRPANSPGFPVSLTVLLQISRSHGLGTETHGFCFLSPAVYKLRVNKCSLGPIIALKCL